LKHSALNKLVLIGASTGGPGQIERIVNELPTLNDTSIIIAQHMINEFIQSFAKRLKEHTLNNISMAENNTPLKAGEIYLCNGLTTVIKSGFEFSFANEPTKENRYNPNINELFYSLVSVTDKIKILCVLLTGIGEDGVDGCKYLSLNKARCITESKESAIVDGMPYCARKKVPNIEIYDISEIINKIKEFCS